MTLRRLLLLVALVGAAVGLGSTGTAAAADWCGTVGTSDRSSVFGGDQIRVWYALPSDASDRSAALAPAISREIDAIEEWWRGQDGERAPRFSRTGFACGPQVDLRLLRLPQPSAALQPTDGRFETIARDVLSADGSPALTHLVFFDGALDDDGLCGQGAGDGTSPGVAIVYLAACGDVPPETTAAHELLHALGALPRSGGPPHACPDSPGHPCDSESDILYPYASTAGLAALVLDVGHDDYYAHSGAWLDVQDSPWLKLTGHQVSVTLGSTGAGAVRFDTPGGVCSSVPCTMQWDQGAKLTVYADAAPGQRLRRWTGACAGQAGACALQADAAAAATAEFVAASFPLTVRVSGNGRVQGGGTSCARACSRSVTSFTPVRLVAHARPGWRLVRWSGACRGVRTTCTVPMTGPTRVVATFARR